MTRHGGGRPEEMPLPRKSTMLKNDVALMSATTTTTASRRNRLVHKTNGLRKQASVSELLTNFVFNSHEDKENDALSLYDFRNKPDLWMAAFDNPVEFIQYCRKRLDHERSLMERSRQVENDIVQLLERWEENSGKYREILEDLYKVQGTNDKLQEIIMEERTHCQHLIGINDELETQRRIMARKYQAALLLGKVDEKSVEHLLEKDPQVVPLADKVSDIREKMKKCDSKTRKKPECTDPIILADKVKQLEGYIHGLKKQHREEVTVLKDTIDKYDLKCEAMTHQYQDLLKRNAQSFQEMKDSLSFAMHENMALRRELLKKDEQFLQVQMDEINSVVRKRPSRTKSSVDEISEAFEECTAIEKDLKLRLARTEIELVEKSNLLRDAMTKIIMLERKCGHLEQDNLFMKKTHEGCIANLKSRNEILEKRVETSEHRRRVDNSGFREDIRELRRLLKAVNKNTQKLNRITSEMQLEPEGVPSKASDRDLEAILLKKQSADSFKSWLKEANPKKSQQAISIWSDFLSRKLDELEGRINSKRSDAHLTEEDEEELVVLYDNKARMKRSSEGMCARVRVQNQDSESSGTDYHDPPSAHYISK